MSSRRTWVLRIALIAVCCLGALWLLWFLLLVMRGYGRLQPRRVELSEITSLTGVAFPASAQLVNSLYDPFPRGRSLLAEVAVSAADVDVFIEVHQKQFDTQFAEDKLAAVSLWSPEVDWWPRGQEPALVAVSDRAANPNRTVYVTVNVGVVRGEPDRALLYLFWTRGS